MKARAVRFVPRKRRPPTKGASSYRPWSPPPSACPKCGCTELQWKCNFVLVQRRCTACLHRWIDQEETTKRLPPKGPNAAEEWRAQVAREATEGWQP